MAYLEYLHKFKRHELSLLSVACLPVAGRLHLATELLVFVRFEPRYLGDMLQFIKRLLPQLPEKDRLWVLKEMDQVIEDCNACLGKKSSEHLDAVLLLALSDEQRFSYAQHLVARLNPQQVLVSEAALWSLARLCPLMSAAEKHMLLPKVLAFLQTRTLPENDMREFLQTIFVKVVATERSELLRCCVGFVLQNAADEKFVMLFLSVLQGLDKNIAPHDRQTVLQDLAILFSHTQRKVVEALIALYNQALRSVAPKDKFVHLEVLMQQEAQIEHLETICEILQTHHKTLECPKQQQSIFEFLQSFARFSNADLSGDLV